MLLRAQNIWAFPEHWDLSFHFSLLPSFCWSCWRRGAHCLREFAFGLLVTYLKQMEREQPILILVVSMLLSVIGTLHSNPASSVSQTELKSGLTFQYVLSIADCTTPSWPSPPYRYLWKFKLWIPLSPKPPLPGCRSVSEPSRQLGAWPLTAGIGLSALLASVATSAAQILLPELLAVKTKDFATTMPTSLFEYSLWALLV